MCRREVPVPLSNRLLAISRITDSGWHVPEPSAMGGGTPNALTAFALRNAIAELGEVPPSSIRAGHCFYPDLEHLPFYDSIDLLELILIAEEIADSQLGDVQTLQKAVTDGTVADFILTVLQCHEEKDSR